MVKKFDAPANGATSTGWSSRTLTQGSGSVEGSSVGSSIRDGWAVDHDRASAVADEVAETLPLFGTARVALHEDLTHVVTALPTTFSEARARLRLLRYEHDRDLATMRQFVAGALGSFRACLAVYENASAEQVATTAHYQSKVTFEHAGLLGMTEQGLNDKIDKKTAAATAGWSKASEGTSSTYKYEGQRDLDGSPVTSETTRTRTSNGTTTTVTTSEGDR